MASRRLYPDLNEPWSDVDEDERLESEDTDTGHPLYRDRANATALSYVDSARINYRKLDSTDGVNLSEFEDYYLQHNRRSSRSTPGQNRHLPPHKPHSNSLSSPGLTSSLPPRSPPGRCPLSVGVHVSRVVHRGRRALVSGVRWFVGASLWKRAMTAGLLGLLCAVIYSSLKAQSNTGGKGGNICMYTCKYIYMCLHLHVCQGTQTLCGVKHTILDGLSNLLLHVYTCRASNTRTLPVT